MYVALLLLLFGLGLWQVLRGVQERRTPAVIRGALILAFTVAFFGLLTFWSEMLWFDALGYSGRFWRAIAWQVGTGLVGAAIGAGLLFLVTLPIRRWSAANTWPELLGAAAGAGIGGMAWDEAALFVQGITTDLQEPILGLNVGFYLFTLPLLERLFELLVWLVAVAAIAAMVASGNARAVEGRPPMRGMLVVGAFAAFVVGFAHLRGIFYLLQSEWGVVTGPGWTDVYLRLPVLIGLVVLTPLIGLLPLLPRVRKAAGRLWAARLEVPPADVEAFSALGIAWAAIVLLWGLGLQVAPGLVQWLVVEPNELAYERPYIEHNIRFTREAFDLSDVEDRSFPAEAPLTAEIVEEHRDVLSEIRLWDWRALDSVYAQFQEIRLYYEFLDVDVDRYRINGNYRQVMVSARELDQRNLPAQSQTFVNQVFKYTHGYGVTLAPVHEFTPDGLPQLLVKDLPPKALYPSLEVTRPEIYYGELGRPVVANTQEPEFDHPLGDQNVYVHYEGEGGIRLANLWRRIVFGWTHFGTRFLVSGVPHQDSRVMFHRRVRDRVARVAPFLRLDADPYVALVDGRLVWIQDGYTVSNTFPYSRPFDALEQIAYRDEGERRMLTERVAPWLHGVNYVRNSVKVVVDAYHGTVELYVFEPDDPLVKAWRGVFPDLFRDGAEMPSEVRAHVRYPLDFLLAQGRIYERYHMTDPVVFYNQEDLWVRATERHYGGLEPVDPYYVMWQLPGAEAPEFALILPFTPKGRQVAIGWIAGLCDGENYGRFLAYQFPKEQRIVGPQQVETKIDQDPVLSAQLTLWDQRGSRVLRGNVLAIPIEQSLLYVEPIYLQAETAAYPELRLVVLMVGDNMAYAPTFEEALRQLVGEAPPPEALPPAEALAPVDIRELAREADRLFQEVVRLQSEGEFEAAGRALERLSELLSRLAAWGEGV